MAYARRCSTCSTNWPYMTLYSVCPICDHDTWYLSDGDEVLTQLEASQLVDKHKGQIDEREDTERKMDAAFDGWFLREHRIAPLNILAGVGVCPLAELC